MSFWASISGLLSKLGSGAGPIAADIKIIDVAMAAILKAAQDAKQGTLTPVEALQAIDATLKAVALVAPPVAQFESYVETAAVVAQVAMDLGILTMDHGKPYRGDGINPNIEGGNTPLGV